MQIKNGRIMYQIINNIKNFLHHLFILWNVIRICENAHLVSFDKLLFGALPLFTDNDFF